MTGCLCLTLRWHAQDGGQGHAVRASSAWSQIPAPTRPSWCRSANSSRPSKFSRWGMSSPTDNSAISCGSTRRPGRAPLPAGPAAARPGGEATRVRLRCGHFFGRNRRAAATIAPAAAITSSVRRVSPPKMTSATPLSATAASAFRPGPRSCRRAAGCRGGCLVSMSFTSTNTGSNCVSFTLTIGRRRARVPPPGPLIAGIEQRDSPGPVSGVASRRHPVTADQPGAGQGPPVVGGRRCRQRHSRQECLLPGCWRCWPSSAQ